jgi:uncharacterized membrane protein YjgN (DUF898 family)
MAFQLKDLDSGKTVELKAGDILGRSEGNHQFPLATKMSRSHCQFILEGNIAYILDLNSRNGTYVNSVKIEPNKKTILGDGHILMFGEKTFLLRGGSGAVVNTMIPGVTGEAQGRMSIPIKTHSFAFKASTSELYMLIIKNIFLTILTLGLYIPYARTNLRKFIWKSSSLNSFPFLFRGDPSSLLKSYLILLVGFAVMSGLEHLLTVYVIKGNVMLGFLHSFISFTFFFVVFIWARYSAYSYLVNNSSYRSVSFRMNKGGSKDHLFTSILGAMLCLLTLGIYYPFMACRLERIRWNRTQYGTSPFTYFAENGDYAKLWFKGLFLTIISAGIYYPWFVVSMHQYKLSNLEFGTAAFNSKAKGGEYFWVLIKSSLLLFITLGLAAPFVFNLNLSYFLDHATIKGSLDFDEIVAAAKIKQSGLSDSVADIFDLDVDIGIT